MRLVALVAAAAIALAGCTTGSSSAKPTAEPTTQPTLEATVAPTPELTATPAASPMPTILPPPSGDPGAPGVMEALLRSVPAGSRSVGYTAWGNIKAAAGFPQLSSRSPVEERLAFLSPFGRERAAGSSFGLEHFLGFAETWGFDPSDLEHEFTIDLGDEAAPVIGMLFRPRFDVAPVVARFEERGFERSERPFGAVYSHELDLQTDWARFAPEFTNAAIETGGSRLLVSASPESLDRVLDVMEDAAPSAADDQRNAPLFLLGGHEAALLLLAPDACDELAVEVTVGEPPVPGARYDAFAVLYQSEREGPVGQFVFAYPTPEAAAADLPLREREAREGASARSGRPYAEYVFTVTGARTMDRAAILDVVPGENAPVRLFQMIWAGDASFATCEPA